MQSIALTLYKKIVTIIYAGFSPKLYKLKLTIKVRVVFNIK